VILNSRLYQQSSQPNEHNLGDRRNFSRSYRRRLPGEVLLDALCEITGQPESLHGLPADADAMEQWNHLLPSDFLDAFGRPNSSAAPPQVRETGGSVVQALHLMNSTGLQEKLSGDSPWIARLAGLPAAEAADEIYLRLFPRDPRDDERRIAIAYLEGDPGGGKGEKSEKGDEEAPPRVRIEDLVWSLVNTAEFVLNH